jgi:hypothetical protein
VPSGHIARVKLAQLFTPMIESWCDRLMQRLSLRLARKVILVIKSILKEAMQRGLVGQNVALPVNVEVNKRDQKKLEVGRDIPASRTFRSEAIGGVLRAAPPVAGHRDLHRSALVGASRADVECRRSQQQDDHGAPTGR